MMKRRELLQAAGILAAGSLAGIAVGDERCAVQPENTRTPGKSPVKVDVQEIRLGDGHFLSMKNPLATVDQRNMERQALDILAMPVVQRAKDHAAMRFKLLAGPDIPEEALRNFDGMMEEYAFHYVLMAVNSDANYPKVLHSNFGPPHEWFGMKVPGCRGPGCGDNADNNYAVIPIDRHGRYELHGRRMDPATSDFSFHVTGNISLTSNITSLGIQDAQVNPDGTFVVTIDPEPANGRINHLQTTLDTHYLCIRDSRVDWRQVPNAYRIYRLDEPEALPLATEEIAKIAARFIVDDVGLNFANKQMLGAGELNVFTQPVSSAAVGGMASQSTAKGHLILEDDEAYVLTFHPGGAGYHVVTTNDYWFATDDYWNRQATLNNTQSVANADGSYTYVISGRDPGVHNWIDTGGLRETIIVIRIQLLPRNGDGSYGGSQSTEGRVVKLADLDSALPAGTGKVAAAERKQQLQQRLAEFNLRYVDR